MPSPVVLLILDGWGISADAEWNAIAMGETPVFDQLNKKTPPVAIAASGEEVGLPAGQMGNSEVGHLNIGAGRVVMQDLMRINEAIADKSFFDNPALTEVFDRALAGGSSVHLMGLLSDGGVHSQFEHILALLEMAKTKGVTKVFVHALMDGRDTPPDSGADYIDRLESEIARIGVGRIATITGRFYTMDRDKRWDRVETGYRALVRAEGQKFDSASGAMTKSYTQKITDEFVEPSIIGSDAPLADGDEMILFNFRADRMREIVSALGDDDFSGFDRGEITPKLSITTMSEYHPDFSYPVAFDVDIPKNGIGEVLAAHGLRQFRSAETEKYAHVTFFFNGGVEAVYEGEERRLVPSPHVRTYDLQPEMSCPDVTDGLIEAIESGDYPMMIVNLANGDMVGHTGIWAAALSAVKTIDESVGRIVAACKKKNIRLIITADHGNIESMVKNGKPMTAHTSNPVPLYFIGDDSMTLRQGGALCDIAPTILGLLDVETPAEMTGQTLLVTR